ncbi:MAG: hypothetical protein LBT50_08340 [Prevotellaceae bacterium]|nr:hypothetical protein [Prevotellaceae bacterium]
MSLTRFKNPVRLFKMVNNMKNQGAKIKILLIQPENPRIHKFRKRQFNNFAQITMPYLAAYINTERYEVRIIDEYNQKIPYN